MMDFLTSISDFFSAIGGIILNLVNGLVYLVTLIPQAMTYITVSLGYMPAPLLAFAMAILSLCIVYLIIGR